MREWFGLAVIALPCMLYSMDLTVLNLAIPALSSALKPSSTQLLWIIDVYGFMAAGLLMAMGSLGERIGRRRLLLIGAAAFGGASVAAAFSSNANMLIAMRALLGVAGAALAPSTLSLVRNMFHDPRQRTLAIGVWVSSYSMGAAIGPVLGGALLEHFWWGSVFLAGVPVMVLLLLVGPWLLPEFRDPQAPAIDLPSAGLSLVAVLSSVWGMKRGVAEGWEVWPVAAILVGLLAGRIFLRRQMRLAAPMIDLRLFREKAFSATLAVYGLGTLGAFGMFTFIGQYLQLVVGMTPLQAGLWTTPIAAAFILGAMLTPALTRRVEPATVLTIGLLLAALGFGLLSQAGTTTHPAVIAVAFVIYSLGLAPVFTLATDLVVGSAPPQQAGVAAAMSETVSELGSALGIALLGSLGAAVYRNSLEGVPLEGLSQQAIRVARGTFAMAVEMGHDLGGMDGAALADAARVAFMAGLRSSAFVAMLIMLAGAAIVMRHLRSRAAGTGALIEVTQSQLATRPVVCHDGEPIE
jgi:DHA2 family multidrug resistance protein-like MFS transporter